MKKVLVSLLAFVILFSIVGCKNNQDIVSLDELLRGIEISNQCEYNTIYTVGSEIYFLKNSRIYRNPSNQEIVATDADVLTFAMSPTKSEFYYVDASQNIHIVSDKDSILVAAEDINSFMRGAFEYEFDIATEKISWIRIYDNVLYINMIGVDLIGFDILTKEFSWISDFVDFAVICNNRIYSMKHARYPGIFVYDIAMKNEEVIAGTEKNIYTNICSSANGVYAVCRENDKEFIQEITMEGEIKEIDTSAERILLCDDGGTVYAALFNDDGEKIKCQIINLKDNSCVQQTLCPSNVIPIQFNVLGNYFVFSDFENWGINKTMS